MQASSGSHSAKAYPVDSGASITDYSSSVDFGLADVAEFVIFGIGANASLFRLIARLLAAADP
jgi:hypothetical protein